MLRSLFTGVSNINGFATADYNWLTQDIHEDLALAKVFLFDFSTQKHTLRDKLYNFSFPFPKHHCLDLGLSDIIKRRESIEAIVEVNKQAAVQLEITDELHIDQSYESVLIFSPEIIDLTSQTKKIKPSSITMVGTQRHLSRHEPIFKTVPLGNLLNDISLIEPLTRQAEQIIFDLNCIKAADAMNSDAHPCGFSIIQACKIARYIGFSDAAKHVQIILPKNLNAVQSNAAAMMIWYFLEGREQYLAMLNKNSNFTSYVLSSEHLDIELEFIKDEISTKWWLKNPFNHEERIPCNYSDYQRILDGEDPSHMLDLFEMA